MKHITRVLASLLALTFATSAYATTDPRPVNYDATAGKIFYRSATADVAVPYETSDNFDNIRDFGTPTTCSGSTTVSDTAAVQAAINDALATNKDIVAPGRCYLATSVFITHPVNVSAKPLRFFGGGYYTNAAITMFDSSNAYYAVGGGPASNPPEDEVQFDGVDFTSSSTTLSAYVISGKFLRVKFLDNVEYHNIKLVNSPTYLQSWVIGGTAYRWDGVWAQSAGSYDTTLRTRSEWGDEAYHFDGAYGNVGLRVQGALLEGSTGPFLSASYILGLSIDGLYTEGNSNPDLKFNLDTRDNRGISITGSYLQTNATNQANSSFYNIVLSAQTKKLASSGNYFSARGYDNPAGSDMSSTQDYADVAVTKNALPTGGGGSSFTPWYGAAVLPSTTPITMVSSVTQDVISLALPVDSSTQEYDVSGEVQQTFTTSPLSATPTSFTVYVNGINTVAATLPAVPDSSRNGFTGAAQIVTHPTAPLLGSGFVTGLRRVSVPASTAVTVYLPYNITFTGTAPTAYGVIRARRVQI